MADLNKIKSFYFLGIGGIGMSALARYFRRNGAKVSGYDKTPTPLTEALIKEGIHLHFEEDVKKIPKDVQLVVYTPAVPKDHKEYVFLKENNFPIMKRSEILAEVVKDTFTIAVSGTHGKTTITAMIAHILKTAGKDVMAFVGGITKNYNSNLILSEKNKISVVEADEYDRSFLQLHPDMAVISAMDADHLDIYGDQDYMVESFTLFAKQIRKNGKLFLKKSLKLSDESVRTCSYSAKQKADFYADNIEIRDGAFYFTLYLKGEKEIKIKAGVPGYHNVENAVAAASVATTMGVSSSQIKKALESYQGVLRRFDYRINEKELIFIDDYAHHPEEIKACLNAARMLYPKKKITGIFQPHLYTRTRDLAGGFAESLALLDELILLDIYPARELPIEGVTSEMLLKKIKMKNKVFCSREELVEELIKRDLEVLITLGAGDIDQLVLPIEKSLKNILKVQKEF